MCSLGLACAAGGMGRPSPAWGAPLQLLLCGLPQPQRQLPPPRLLPPPAAHPLHLPHLIDPFKHYLWILKTTHSGGLQAHHTRAHDNHVPAFSPPCQMAFRQASNLTAAC